MIASSSPLDRYDPSQDTVVPHASPPFAGNTPGPFYIAEGCTLCMAPATEAPGMIADSSDLGMAELTSCTVYRQPISYSEVRVMIRAMAVSCVECVRYRGTDTRILSMLADAKQKHLADCLDQGNQHQ
jgi:hypothetical protein